MANTKISQLTTFTGDTSGSYLVMDDSTLSGSYKVTKEKLLSNINTNVSITGSLHISGSDFVDLDVNGVVKVGVNDDAFVGIYGTNTTYSTRVLILSNSYVSEISPHYFDLFKTDDIGDGDEIVLTIKPDYWVTGTTTNTPQFLIRNGTGNFETLIEFPCSSSWNNGTIKFKQNTEITGSLKITGSLYMNGDVVIHQLASHAIQIGGNDKIVFISRSLIIGDEYGQHGALIVHSNGAPITSEGIESSTIQNISRVDPSDTSNLYGGGFISNTIYTSGSYIKFQDYDNGGVGDGVSGNNNSTYLQIGLNISGSNPPPQFVRGLGITGSLNVSGSSHQIIGNTNITGSLNLSSVNPLPSGNLGDLVVSGSNLYFYNGTVWMQMNGTSMATPTPTPTPTATPTPSPTPTPTDGEIQFIIKIDGSEINYSDIQRSLDGSKSIDAYITSVLPISGVTIDVVVNKDADMSTVFNTSISNSSSSSNPITITSLNSGILCTVRVTVTSRVSGINTSTKTFKIARS
jgi:hypothetical protein